MLHGRLVWPTEQHVFSSQARDLSKNLPGRPVPITELGPPKKVSSHVLNDHPVEFLFVDEEEPEVWIKWLMKTRCNLLPEAFIWMGPGDALGNEAQGPIAKNVCKNLERLGYKLQYWLLSAEKVGSAVAQDRLVLVGTLMSNLLMPVGVPSKAWHRGQVQKSGRTERWLPCEIIEETEGDPIFQ
jgi:hypothetical protein